MIDCRATTGKGMEHPPEPAAWLENIFGTMLSDVRFAPNRPSGYNSICKVCD
jgi:hypothetical protein